MKVERRDETDRSRHVNKRVILQPSDEKCPSEQTPFRPEFSYGSCNRSRRRITNRTREKTLISVFDPLRGNELLPITLGASLSVNSCYICFFRRKQVCKRFSQPLGVFYTYSGDAGIISVEHPKPVDGLEIAASSCL